MVSRGRVTLAVAAGLALAALLAYANSFSVPLLLDDWATIQENPRIRQLWPLWEALSPPANTGVGGRPVANLAFVLNHAATGDSLAGYHAINLAIHLAAALLLFGLVRRIVRGLAPSRPSQVDADLLAAGAAALWLLHPMQTQSVTYISQRTESLMGCLYLATLYAAVRLATERRAVWGVGAVLACALGMGTKEGMVTAPLAVLLCDRWFIAGSFARAWRERRALYVGLAATWLLLPLLMTGLGGRGVGFGERMAWHAYALTELEAVAHYLWLSLWPARLVFDYGTDLPPPGIATVASGLVILGLVAVAVLGTIRKTAWGFLAAWFLLTLAPTSSVVPIPLAPIAENRPYLALAAVMVGVSAALAGAGPAAGRALLAVAAVALGLRTFDRNADYRDEVTIWADAAAKTSGNARAHNNLGDALMRRGRLDEARLQFEKAEALRPGYADAVANLSAALGALGRHEDALATSRRALALDREGGPMASSAAHNMGIALSHLGRLQESLDAFGQAVKFRPTNAEAHGWAANVLLRLGRPAEAAQMAEAAVRLKPGMLEPAVWLGAAWLQLKRTDDALAVLTTAAAGLPGNTDAHYLLGTALLLKERTAESIGPLEASLRLNPNHPGAHANLGLALARLNQPAAAIPHLEAALRLNPNDAASRQALELVRSGRRP